MLMFGMYSGVPRERRGEIWLLLVEQHRLRHSMHELSTSETEGSAKYDDLLKRLTLHQHAILIDLGIRCCLILDPYQSALVHILTRECYR